MLTRVAALFIIASLFVIAPSQPRPGRKTQMPWPAGYWPIEKSQPIIEKTQTIRLAPDLSGLSAGEKLAVRKLLEVGNIFQKLYEDQRHAQALSAYEKLFQLHMRVGNPAPTENLLMLYRLFQGPIATTLENKREPFLPVDPVVPGKNVYPWGVKKEEIEASFASNSANRDDLLDLRSVVRRATAENLRADLAKLAKYPVLDTLHPGLKSELGEILAHRDITYQFSLLHLPLNCDIKRAVNKISFFRQCVQLDL